MRRNSVNTDNITRAIEEDQGTVLMFEDGDRIQIAESFEWWLDKTKVPWVER